MTDFALTLSNARLADDADLDLQPPRILLAEDDAAMREVLVDALVEAGYDVIVASDGHELLDRIGEAWLEEDYDLVLSDVRMPGCSGLRAIEALRERDWATPIVFMTAFGSPRAHGEAQRLGASMLDKPFEVDELLDTVRALVPPQRYREGWR